MTFILSRDIPKLILFSLGILLYFNTFTFQFALDDKIVIVNNKFTKQGTEGISDIFKNDAFTGFFGKKKNLVEGGRYRPLTLAYFAVVWEFFGPEEGTSEKIYNQKKQGVATFLHINNALFYGFTGIMLFTVLALLFPMKDPDHWYTSKAFLISLLYLVHPLHTEVVANIKSLDEIWSFLAGLIALYAAIKFIDQEKKSFLIIAFLAVLMGSFAKETIVVFLGVIPLTILFFRNQTSIKEDLKSILFFKNKKLLLQYIFVLTPVIMAFGIYFVARSSVLGDQSGEVAAQLMNKPFLYASGSEKVATILFTMLIYLKLLIVPHPLTHDYYPWHPVSTDDFVWDGKHFPYITLDHPLVWLSVILYLGMIGYGFWAFFKGQKRNILAFCFLLFVGTFILFSNLFFEIGVFMNERFMYVPSLAFCIALVWILKKYLPKISAIIIALITIVFAYFTYQRNWAWENDQELALADYETSKNSAKVNMSAGGAYYERSKIQNSPTQKANMLNKSIQLLQRSIQLYPGYLQSKTLLGHAFYEAQLYDNSIAAYESGLKQSATFKDIENAIFIISDTLNRAKKGDQAIKYLEMLAKYQPSNAKVYAELGKTYGMQLGNIAKAKENLIKANQLDSTNINVLENLGVAYGFEQKFDVSLQYFLKALALDPNKPSILRNVGITYMNLGKPELAQEYLQKAEKK